MQPINIVPRKYLEETANQPYHISLYQELIKDDEYMAFYKRMLAEGKFVMMDNGAAEGVNPTLDELLPIYDELQPSEIILPDVVGQKEETLRRTKEAYERLVDMGYHEKMQFMAVPQGATFTEWLECMHVMISQEHITTIGVSKFVTKLYKDELGESVNVRLECVDAIINYAFENKLRVPEIHLLGCYYTPYEVGDIEQTFPDAVRSTDSAIAYVYTRNGMQIEEDERPDQKEIDFSGNDVAHEHLELLKTNMKQYTKICCGN